MMLLEGGILHFNPRPVRAFLITRTVRGGGVGTTPPPWRSAPDGPRASRKRPVDAPRRDLAIAHIVFGPRSIFDLVRSGQRSNFREKWHFLALHAHSGVSMCRSDLKPSPACFSLNSEQDRVILLYPVAIFSIRSASGGGFDFDMGGQSFESHIKFWGTRRSKINGVRSIPTYHVKFLVSLGPRIRNYINHVLGMSVPTFFLATDN